MRITITGILLIFTGLVQAEPALTIATQLLNYDIANKAATSAIDECSKRGYKVAAAVTGRDGNLLAFVRHPLAGPHTIQVSQRKAYTAATLQSPTGAQIQKERPDLNHAPGILLIQGAQPINIAGHFYGGIAVAGADTNTDESCAKHGLAVISEALEFAN
jgi:uncharacterized protein GlcG (DUF336 family)